MNDRRPSCRLLALLLCLLPAGLAAHKVGADGRVDLPIGPGYAGLMRDSGKSYDPEVSRRSKGGVAVIRETSPVFEEILLIAVIRDEADRPEAVRALKRQLPYWKHFSAPGTPWIMTLARYGDYLDGIGRASPRSPSFDAARLLAQTKRDLGPFLAVVYEFFPAGAGPKKR